MSEERLEIIKENVYMRSEIAKKSRLGIDTSLGEELELLKEIERLNNIIKQIYEIFKNGLFEDGCDCIQIEELITRELKGEDKE